MADSGIYEIVNLRNGKRYVGSAVNFAIRWRQHRRLLNRGEHYSPAMQRAWIKYGPDAFDFRVIRKCGRHELLAAEQDELDRRWPEYNNCPTAGSSLGRVLSPETRAKIAASKVGLKMPPRSHEHRAKLSEAIKRRPANPERVAKMAATKRGVKLSHEHKAKVAAALQSSWDNGVRSRERSPEYRAKIAASLRGRTLTPEHRAAVSTAMRGKKRGPYNISAEERLARSERAKRTSAARSAARWGKPHPG